MVPFGMRLVVGLCEVVLANQKLLFQYPKCGVSRVSIDVPLHYIYASYARRHFNSSGIGIQDAPRPYEITFALLMGTSPRVHSRFGGLTKDKVSIHD
jgi:hypothetical protein